MYLVQMIFYRLKKRNESDKIISRSATQKEYDMYLDHMESDEKYLADLTKDSVEGHDLMWCKVEQTLKNGKLLLNNFNGETVFVDAEKESYFEDYMRNLVMDDVVQIHVERMKGCLKGSFKELQTRMTFNELFKSITDTTIAFTGVITDKNEGGFYLDINGIKTFLPGSLATANKVENFELADWIGKEIKVMVETYSVQQDIFIVSNKKYLKTILPQLIQELELDKKYKGKVTGIAKFGIFVQFDSIFTGLIHVAEMNETMLNDFNSGKFKPTNEIEFNIKEIQKDNRIILTTINYKETKKHLSNWFELNKGSVYNVKVKRYNKHTNEYTVKLVENKQEIPKYAQYGILKSKNKIS